MSELRRGVAAAMVGVRLAGTAVVAGILSSLYLIVAARQLGAERFSDVAVCLSLSYVGLLFLGPLNLTLIRFSASYRSADDEAQIRPLLAKAMRWYAPWTVAVLVAAVALAAPIARALNIGSVVLVPMTGALVAIGIALGAVRATALGLNHHGRYSGSILIDTIVRVAVGLVLIATLGTAVGAVGGFLAGSATALAVLGWHTLRRLPGAPGEWAESDAVASFMVRALVFSAIAAGLQNGDMIAAKARFDTAAAGDYAVALAVARSFLLLAAPFGAVALAQPVTTARPAGWWPRLLHAPVAAYLALAVPAALLLTVAPDAILTMLFGTNAQAQAQLLPILGVAYLTAGIFLILAHVEIRAGRFGFLAPLAAVLAAELILLALAPAAPLSVAWVVLGAQVAALGSVLVAPRVLARRAQFRSSAQYWDQRYIRGGASGEGSRGKFAAFKAEVLNAFVARHEIQSVIEFGCGDGQQLALANYPQYLGFDVSAAAVRLCRLRFSGDDTKVFREVASYAGERAELTLSLDVIYHLVEDEVFDNYMRMLFESSTRWVVVYASNHDDTDRAEAAHVRHRQFTRWVETHRPGWALRERIPNRYPFTGDFRLGSFSDFFIFERA